ncbi:hypothetical protein ACFV2H_36890 [Streptomyces sp. NPDC059629]|uniref:hypothetical protein n=1 Tax=Streptomyces sp. NPDC059629 TaxID=3346889 RepID=UPI003696FF58
MSGLGGQSGRDPGEQRIGQMAAEGGEQFAQIGVERAGGRCGREGIDDLAADQLGDHRLLRGPAPVQPSCFTVPLDTPSGGTAMCAARSPH